MKPTNKTNGPCAQTKQNKLQKYLKTATLEKLLELPTAYKNTYKKETINTAIAIYI
jgi:hypothetical protein